MTYCSFDIGRKHMAFVCMVNDDVVYTSINQVDGTCQKTFEYMNSLKEYILKENVLILVEQQMPSNGKAFALQNQICMYCVCHQLKYRVVSSRLKTPRDLNYAQRKLWAVDVAKQHNVPFVEGYKLDDIADAFVQILAVKHK